MSKPSTNENMQYFAYSKDFAVQDFIRKSLVEGNIDTDPHAVPLEIEGKKKVQAFPFPNKEAAENFYDSLKTITWDYNSDLVIYQRNGNEGPGKVWKTKGQKRAAERAGKRVIRLMKGSATVTSRY